MGLGDSDLLAGDDGDAGDGKVMATEVSCSICLEAVMDNGDRSWSKLQCGHIFHLDCIGSAFNIKGAMQCPNCRKIEKGKWLYANDSGPLPDYTMINWSFDEDIYDLRYSEMSFGVHWCPFNGSARLPTSFDERDFLSNAYHAIFPEHNHVSSATHHPCPYIAYMGPMHQSSSASSGGSISDISNFNNNNNNNNHSWGGPNEVVPSSYPFPHYWDQPSIPAVTRGANRSNSDMTRHHGMRQFVVGHGSAIQPPGYVASSVLPPYPGHVSRLRDIRPSFPAYFQQSNSITSNGRRSSSHRGSAQADQSSGFYFFSSSSSGRTFQESENPVQEQWFNVWEWEHQPSFPLNQINRDSIWGPVYQPTGGFDTGIRSNGFRQRHGPDRTPQNRS